MAFRLNGILLSWNVNLGGRKAVRKEMMYGVCRKMR